MSKEAVKAQLEILEWVIRLTLCGMPIGMLRYYVLKKMDELEKCLDGDGKKPVG